MSYTPKKSAKRAPINASLVAAIAAFMAAEKIPIGVDVPQVWQPGRELGSGEYTVKIPLEINGEIGDQKLIINSTPNAETLKFCVLISFEPAVCRLDYDEGDVHLNSHAIGEDSIDPLVQGPHYHPWELNQRFFTHSSKAIELHNAVPFEENIRQFDSALRWFCAKNKVILPHDHRIELPPKSMLL